MLVIYGDQTAWQTMSEHQRGQVLHLHASLVAELRRSGELIAGAGLADPEDTMIVRGDVPEPTGRPQHGEHMSAVYLIDCTRQRAHTLARRMLDPTSRESKCARFTRWNEALGSHAHVSWAAVIHRESRKPTVYHSWPSVWSIAFHGRGRMTTSVPAAASA